MSLFKKRTFILFTMFVLLFSLLASPVFADDNTTREDTSGDVVDEQTGEGNAGMVVTAHPEASKVGAEILKRGGNAVDAAIAVQFALNVVEPHMSGIGGGGFMMYYDAATEDIKIINSRERAPQAATPDMFYDKSGLVLDEGGVSLSAIDWNPDEEENGAIQIRGLSITDLVDDSVLHYDFAGESGEAWDEESFDLYDENGASFLLDEESGKIQFGPAVEESHASYGSAVLNVDPLKNVAAELDVRFDPAGEDDHQQFLFWVRTDEESAGNTAPYNGIGFVIDSDRETLEVFHYYEDTQTLVGSIEYTETDQWQTIQFTVEDDQVKLRVSNAEEVQATVVDAGEWDIDEVLLGQLPSFQERVRSGKSVGVPGTLKGLETAYEEWGSGKLTWEELIAPAIELARDGHEVNWQVASSIASNAEKLSRTAAKEVFLPNGEPLKEGDMLIQPDLAKTLELIAQHGSEVFYNGDIAKAIVQEVQKFGGWMEEEDLSKYDVTIDDPVWGTYKGYEIASMPPPSSGGLTILQILKMTELLDVTSFGIQSPQKYHYLAEAFRLAYADRGKYMGDPEHADIPEKGLLNDDYIAERVELIQDGVANANVEPGDPWAYEEYGQEEVETKFGIAVNPDDVDPDADRTDGETTHFTVADQWGNMVSYTTTIEQVFGSGIMVDGYGFLLNNELTDFDGVPGGVNQVDSWKRPLSSMSPTIVLKNGKPYMTVGSPGGPTIITSVMQTILNTIGYGLELKEAIEEPRIYTNAYPNIRWEEGIPEDVRKTLEDYGHAWEANPVDIGNVNALQIEEDENGEKVYYGAADSTRQGTAIGVDHADVTELQALLDEIADAGLKREDYTEDSWNTFQEAVTTAEALLKAVFVDSVLPEQEEVDEVYDALLSAFEGLVEVVEEPTEPEQPADKSALESKVEEVDELDPSDFTEESWKALQEALEEARAVLEDENATQEEIDAALAALSRAFDSLVEADEEEGKTPAAGKDEDKKTGEGGKLPKTAANMFNSLLIGFVLLAAGIVVYRLRKMKASN